MIVDLENKAGQKTPQDYILFHKLLINHFIIVSVTEISLQSAL